jgi:hypothetical protein
MNAAVFEPAITTSELSRTYAFRRAASNISPGDMLTHTEETQNSGAEVPELTHNS